MLSAVILFLIWEPIRFREHLLASDLRGGYQVVVADVNGDGIPDLIALASGMTDLFWFEGPGFAKRHVLASGLPRMINLAAADTDGDRIPEILVAYEFSNDAAKSLGIVSLLSSNGGADVRQPWKVREIDRLTTSHRLRAAHVDGQVVFVNAPLTGAEAKPPDYRARVPLVLYRPGIWKRETIAEDDKGVVHGLWVGRWHPGDRSDSILTSSFRGIHRYEPRGGGRWRASRLTSGNPAPWPQSGSSEIAPGEGWYASLEPWHGNQVVVYEKGRRKVIESGLVDGHVLLAGDFDGDRRSEIVASYRGAGRCVYLYAREAGGTWSRQTIDNGGMAGAGCAIADLNGDGRLDVACIGSATANLKWYENLGRHSHARSR